MNWVQLSSLLITISSLGLGIIYQLMNLNERVRELEITVNGRLQSRMNRVENSLDEIPENIKY